MRKISLLPNTIERILEVIKENDVVTPVAIIEHSFNNGIGSCIDIEFEINLNGRFATARIPVVDENDW